MIYELLVLGYTLISLLIQIKKGVEWFNKTQECKELRKTIGEKIQIIEKNFQEIREGLVICIKNIPSISSSDLYQEIPHEAEANITRVYDLMIDSFEKLAELKTLMSSHAMNCLNNQKDRAKLRVSLENFDRAVLKVINQMPNALSQILDTSDPQEAIKSFFKLFEVSEPTEDDKSLALPFIETIISVRGKISIEEITSAPHIKKYINTLIKVVEAGRPYNF
jgi:hypothetical protein